MAGTSVRNISWFYCVYGAIIDLYWENPVAFGSGSFSSNWKHDMVVAFSVIGEHVVYDTN